LDAHARGALGCHCTAQWLCHHPGRRGARASPEKKPRRGFPCVSSSKLLTLYLPPGGLRRPRGATCQGFVPLRGVARLRKTNGEAPKLALIRPRAFSTPRRFVPGTRPRACCRPQPRPGFAPFRGFSLREAALVLVGRSVPPCRWSGRVASDGEARRPLGFEALLLAEERASGAAVSPRLPSLPSSVFSLLRVHSRSPLCPVPRAGRS